jgi:prephenate dehydratase
MRHIILGRQINAPTGHDQTLIMLRIEDKPGALVSALEPFRQLQVNLAHFASRPSQKDKADTFFFVQTDGHVRDLETNGLLDALMQSCRSVKILGSYPKPQP